MREHQWDEGRYLADGHSWCMLLDIPTLPREDTGESVVLQPPKWASISGIHAAPALECKIHFVPEANIYIAIGEKANGYWDVLFYDLISVTEEHHRRSKMIQQED